jgi:hypothetical protein
VFATGEDESCASCPGCGALLPAESSAAQAGPIPVSATALPTAHTMLGFQLKFVLFTLGLVIVIACVMQLRR